MADRRVMRRVMARAIGALVWLTPALALAQEERPQLEFSTRLIFWTGAVIVMALVARVVFREQLAERRTLRRMMDEIGPFFPEFDIDSVKRWVHAAAPHIWDGWRRRDLSSIEGYVTERFLAEQAEQFDAARRAGHEHAAKLVQLLKVHPLGLYPMGDGPPPRDLELMLRLEQKAIDCRVQPDGTVIEGSTDPRQIMHFWTLVHDGRRWRIDRVWRAEPGDDVDLRDKPPLPPLMAWKRPEDPESDSEGGERVEPDGETPL